MRGGGGNLTMSQRVIPTVPSNYVESEASDVEQTPSAIGEDELLAKLGLTPVPISPLRKVSIGDGIIADTTKLNVLQKSVKTTEMMTVDVTVFRLIDINPSSPVHIEVGIPSLVHKTAECTPPDLVFDETFQVQIPNETTHSSPSILTFVLKEGSKTVGYTGVKLSHRILAETGYWSHGLPICNGVLYVMMRVASIQNGVTLYSEREKLTGVEKLLQDHIEHGHILKKEQQLKENNKTDASVETLAVQPTNPIPEKTENNKEEIKEEIKEEVKVEVKPTIPPLVAKETIVQVKRDLRIHTHASNLEKRSLSAVVELEKVSRSIVESEFTSHVIYEKTEFRRRLADAAVRDMRRTHEDENHQTKKSHEEQLLELKKSFQEEARSIRNEGAENLRQARISHEEYVRQLKIQQEEYSRAHVIEQDDIRRQQQIAYENTIREHKDEFALVMKEQEDEFLEKQTEIEERHNNELNAEKQETENALSRLDYVSTRLVNTRMSSCNVLSRSSALRLSRYCYNKVWCFFFKVVQCFASYFQNLKQQQQHSLLHVLKSLEGRRNIYWLPGCPS